jgi:hypothetical protein
LQEPYHTYEGRRERERRWEEQRARAIPMTVILLLSQGHVRVDGRVDLWVVGVASSTDDMGWAVGGIRVEKSFDPSHPGG